MNSEALWWNNVFRKFETLLHVWPKNASWSSKRDGTCLAVVFIVSLNGCSGDKRKNFELVSRSSVSHANSIRTPNDGALLFGTQWNLILSLIQLDKSFADLWSASLVIVTCCAVIEWIILLARCEGALDMIWRISDWQALPRAGLLFDDVKARCWLKPRCWLGELCRHASLQTVLAARICSSPKLRCLLSD